MADLDPCCSAPRRGGHTRPQIQGSGADAVGSDRASVESAADYVLRISAELNRRLA
ncbi:hypothetical protein [Nocardia abscessus]|uniref:hypothetical protein n=1 Tax=Nocardia abscessus TaxID=120957 RepID=UPI002456A118|nr:hypothetical protein [Nocardia abscessus]